jgi:DNA modification methylase
LVGNGRRTIKDRKPRENIWEYKTGSGKTVCTDHPAAYPEELAGDHIISWSNEGDIVLDPFSGSGTTAKVAKHNARKYVGIEINPDYCEIASNRLAQDVLF